MTQPETSRSSGLGDLEPGTRQRAQLSVRIADIAWSALCVVVALWALWSSLGALHGTATWGYCAVTWVLLGVALTVRVLTARRRARK
jgi:hypothetical protein